MLLIRADASTKMGTGHAMRMLALAQAWLEQGGKVAFAAAELPRALEERLCIEGLEVFQMGAAPASEEDATHTAALARKLGAAWIVLDGYHFRPEYQQRLKHKGQRLLVMDDMAHLPHYYADVILNQNLYAEKLSYPCGSHTQLLLGTKFVLLRREFWSWQGWKREIPEVARRVLVTLGGSDPNNATLKVLRALNQIEEDLEVRIVVGGGNPHYAMLDREALVSKHRVSLERNVADMPRLMAWADIAVSAGGTTCWEMSYMGLPMLVITLEDNQVEVAHSLAETGAARSLGWHNQVSVEEIVRAVHELCRSRSVREEMSAKAAALVDGEGSSRLVAFLRGEPLRLRRVREEDCGLLWEWINEPEVRSMSFSSQHIPWEDHVAWFISRIDSSDHILMIALNQIDEPVGLVRFDLEDDEATISIVIDPRFRGQGYGSMLIKMGSRWLLRGKRTRLIHAYIKPQNLKSSSAFERAGYQFMGSRVVRGQSALHYVLEGGK